MLLKSTSVKRLGRPCYSNKAQMKKMEANQFLTCKFWNEQSSTELTVNRYIERLGLVCIGTNMDRAE